MSIASNDGDDREEAFSGFAGIADRPDVLPINVGRVSWPLRITLFLLDTTGLVTAVFGPCH